MRESATSDNVRNGVRTYAKFFSQFYALAITMPILCSNLKRLFIGQFGKVRLLSATISPSVLARSILHIIALSSEKTVKWITANWVVAFVKHIKPIWDWTIDNFPRNPMSHVGSSIKTEASVSTRTSAIQIWPARIFSSNLHFVPKSLWHCSPFGFPRLKGCLSMLFCHTCILPFLSLDTT